MLRGVHLPTHVSHPRGDAGRRLAVHDRNRLDLLFAIVDEPRVHSLRIDAVAPVARHELDAQPQPRRHVAPQRREMAGLEHQHGVAGRQRVDERRFPGASTRRGVNDDRARGLKDSLEPLEHGAAEGREVGTAVIDRRLRHGAQHAIGHVGRSRDLEEMSAGFHAN